MLMPFRFLLVAPFTLIALFFFAGYFGLKNRVGKIGMIPLVLTFGVGTAVTNPVYNILFGTFVFWELPPLRNQSGEISLFFTTRIKERMTRSGQNDAMTYWYVWAINKFDPDHFNLERR